MLHRHPPHPADQPGRPIRDGSEPSTEPDDGLQDLDLGLEGQLLVQVVRRDVVKGGLGGVELGGEAGREGGGGRAANLLFEGGCVGEMAAE